MNGPTLNPRLAAVFAVVLCIAATLAWHVYAQTPHRPHAPPNPIPILLGGY